MMARAEVLSTQQYVVLHASGFRITLRNELDHPRQEFDGEAHTYDGQSVTSRLALPRLPSGKYGPLLTPLPPCTDSSRNNFTDV